MPNLSPEQRAYVQRECEGLAGRERTRKVAEMAAQHNVHSSTIYRTLGRSERQRRADKGAERCDIPEEALEKMLALSTIKEMSAPEVIEQTEMAGQLAPGTVSPATFNRMLGRRHLAKRQLEQFIRPFYRHEESRSNERHYIDITGFPDYFVEGDGSIGFESPLSVSKNRAGNRKPRLQLFWLTDGYSRAQYGRFYMGKNTLNWVDFCIKAWGPKDDVYTYPFQGRPTDLYSDMESIFFTPMMTRFLDAMGVRYHHHVPGNSRAKGKVERAIGVVEKWIRHAFSLKQRLSLTEANAYLDDMLYKVNGRVHGETRQEPMQRWRAGFPSSERIRLMPPQEVTDRFFYTANTRKIEGDLTVSLGGRKWQLPRKTPFVNYSGFTVPVYYHRGEPELREIYVVLDDVEYAVEHSEPKVLAAGQYRALPKTDQEKLLEELSQVDVSDLDVSEYKERYARRTFLPAETEELDVAALRLPRQAVGKIQLKMRLQELGLIGTPPTREQRDYVEGLYRDGEVYEDQYDAICEHLSGAAPRRAVAL